ncbi:uncharacterized protein LOC130655421 [Hydractinia symbiolongicarpus]|uniref:uncharacterized protein LOC130655421 n=1 Tax=Hydractinia symbiolongicarpus TaxID=13093 RepID=UPI00255030EB|nr:uncharacterized protein LOC130655421 [Hydractinia symbiolongicarpus]
MASSNCISIFVVLLVCIQISTSCGPPKRRPPPPPPPKCTQLICNGAYLPSYQPAVIAEGKCVQQRKKYVTKYRSQLRTGTNHCPRISCTARDLVRTMCNCVIIQKTESGWSDWHIEDEAAVKKCEKRVMQFDFKRTTQIRSSCPSVPELKPIIERRCK